MPDEQKPDASLDEELQSGQEPEVGVDGDAAAEGAAEAGSEVGIDKANPDDVADEAAEDEAELDKANLDGAAEEGAKLDEADLDKVVNEGDASEDDAEAAMLAMLENEDVDKVSDGDDFPDLSGIQMEQPQANPAEFQQLSPSSSGGEGPRNIGLLLDVKMPVSIELGRTNMAISELLALGPGSVVELNKLAGEPVDLLVNNKVIARGEVVVVDENFGVRITLLMSPEERLKSMGQ